MDSVLGYAQTKLPEIVQSMKRLVECESPSDSPASVDQFVDLFTSEVADIAKVRTFKGGRFGKHMRCEFQLPGPRKKSAGQILGLGHSDTVHPLGSLASMPWRESEGRLYGPGILDMKGGLVFFIWAMRALRDLDVPVARKVVLQINSDEEVGSETSRSLTEEAAKDSVAVLVLEPGTGPSGKLKTARKGVGNYTVKVRGVAAHAGVDFLNGASAIVELARQIEKIAGFTKLDRGITVNPGVLSGGTRTNVIASEATVEVDIRIAKLKDEAYLKRAFHSLKPFDKRCSIEVTGGLNRPPMERTPGIVQLFKTAKKLAAEVGVTLEESATGGGSDGNFTAAMGVPTLDGLGTVGEGAHTPHENIVIDRIADRTALLAKLVAAI